MSMKLEQERVSKREFLQRAARRSKIPLSTMKLAYDGIIEELLEQVSQGMRVTLTGFGSFFVAKHKGHFVQSDIAKAASERNEPHRIKDYKVLKFSATREVNKSMSGAD